MSNPTFEERLAGVKAEQAVRDFWDARPYLKHVRDAAHARQRSALAVLGVVLTRTAALVSHQLRLPAIVGAEAGLSLITVVLAPPGVGKSTSNHIGSNLLRPPAGFDFADQIPLGSGEGLVELFYGTVTEEDPETGKSAKIRKQVRHNAFIYVDEGQVLTELGNRKGATLLPTIRSVFSGATLGQQNASEERRRIVPAFQYAMGITVAMQVNLAGGLLGDADGGTPQRMLWVPAVDRGIPDDPPAWPGPLPWQPPDAEQIRQLRNDDWLIGNEAYLDVAEPIRVEIRAADLNRARGEVATDILDAHEGLLRLKVAALLAILDGRLNVGEEDWQLAKVLKMRSDQTRNSVVAAVEHLQAERERATADRLAKRAAHADQAVTQRRVVDCARKVAAKVWAEPDRWTIAELRRSMRRYRDEFDDGLDHAMVERWVTEVAESGQGADKRSIRPGSVRPR